MCLTDVNSVVNFLCKERTEAKRMAFKYFGSTILLISVVVHSTHQWCAMGFAVQTASSTFSRLSSSTIRSAPRSQQIRIASDETSSFSSFSSKNEAEGPEDLVACRITVSGDVHGGYYRACVLNEVRSNVIYKSCFSSSMFRT